MSLEEVAIIVNIILIFVLVVITGYYAHQTKRLVKENQKERRMKYLDDKLRFVYSPLLALIKDPNDKPSFRDLDGNEKISYFSKPGERALKAILIKYSYLMSQELSKKLFYLLGIGSNDKIERIKFDKIAEMTIQERKSILDEYNELISFSVEE